MKKIAAVSLCFSCFAAVSTSHAIDFKQSKVTQVVNDVEIISATDQSKKTAAVNDIFTMPDILRTGPASRAELVAQDETITRVGANTIFSFDPASRTIDLQQGSLLFHSPHGKGGGTIHTGSATASVLGSTIEVTATPNGGFKVIVLEDGAEITLPNGLKEKLQPGEMTFILPGGKQLAPIIIFRLDELIKNSLLVKGFNRQLDSLPLILLQIEKQLKLINSGKISDTGLLAGDNAGPNQVEVLDINSIQSDLNTFNQGNNAAPVNPAQAALQSDATINQPSLTDASIPVPPDRIFFDPTFTLSGNSFFNGRSFSGFAGLNIFFNTENLESLSVDMTPYADGPQFDFVAADDLNIEGPVTFSGFSSANSLFLIAGSRISITPNTTVQADVADFELSAPGALTLDGVQLLNGVGDIHLTSGSEITLDDDAEIHAAETTFTAPKAVNISGTFVTIEDATINTDPTHGSVTMSSSDDSIGITGTSIRTHTLTLNSGDGILLDASGQTLTASGSGATVNLTAVNQITVNNADFTSFATINMVANTITLTDVAFAAKSIDSFGTTTGAVNVNGTLIPGGLNLIDDSYGGTAITSASQVNLSSGPGSTPGIYSYPTGGGGESLNRFH
jgi:hypothetical protein